MLNSQMMRPLFWVTGKQNDDQNVNLPTAGTIPFNRQAVTNDASPANITVTQDSTGFYLNLSAINYDPSQVQENMYFYNYAAGGTPARPFIRKIKKVHNLGLIELFDAIPSDITITAQNLLVAREGIYRSVSYEATGSASTATINGVVVKAGEVKMLNNVAGVECICYRADSTNEELTFILGI